MSSHCAWASLTDQISGSLAGVGSKAWFKVVPTTSGTWTFVGASSASTPLRYAYGTLYQLSADGSHVTQIATNYNSVSGGNPLFEVVASLSAGQTYFLEIQSDDKGSGYTLTAVPPSKQQSITVSPADPAWVLSPAAQSKQVSVAVANVTGWTVKSSQSWLTTSKSGNVVTFSVSANTDTAGRTGRVTFTTSGGLGQAGTWEFSVTQLGTAATVGTIALTPAGSSWTPGANGSTATWKIGTNSGGMDVMVFPASASSWLTFEKNGSPTNMNLSLSATAAPNSSRASRSATLRLTTLGYNGTPGTVTIAITQPG